MADEDDGFTRITLRIPTALHVRLNEASAKKRSMNAEIIARLEASFSDPTVNTSTFDQYAQSLMKMTAAEIALQSMQAMIAMSQAMEGKSDAERQRVMMEAMDAVQRDHMNKLASGLTKAAQGPDTSNKVR